MAEREELKLCPFEGGEARTFRSMGPAPWWTQCMRCEAKTGHFRTEAEAITAWNTRPDQARSVSDWPDEAAMRAYHEARCPPQDTPAGGFTRWATWDEIKECPGVVDDIRRSLQAAVRASAPSSNLPEASASPAARPLPKAAQAAKDRETSHQAREKQSAYYRGVRACIAWLHARALTMNDHHAAGVLNSAGFHLGLDKPSPEAAAIGPGIAPNSPAARRGGEG